jgi:hypothetical protein
MFPFGGVVTGPDGGESLRAGKEGPAQYQEIHYYTIQIANYYLTTYLG